MAFTIAVPASQIANQLPENRAHPSAPTTIKTKFAKGPAVG